MTSYLRRLIQICVLAAATAVAAALPPHSEEHVLFAFDDRALPYQQGLRLQMIGYTPASTRADVVLASNPTGGPDANGCYYYGSVVEVNGELWMWYLGLGADKQHRICLATSTDGRKWTRPNLGLVEYNGNRNNNLIDLGGKTFPVVECVVIHDPEDPDPSRRFKMTFQTREYKFGLAVATSADGIRWKEAANPVGPRIEPSGMIKWRGAYHINGQGGRTHWNPTETYPRVLSSYTSYDFEYWTQLPTIGFRRDSLPPRPAAVRANEGEQVHLGASLWHRGNVIIGFYGMWHGSPTNDAKDVTMDIGLVLSHDALHYHEPLPDFPIIEARGIENRAPGSTAQRAPALAHGQGFVNRGEETLVWFSTWLTPADGIRLATWKRDRLGYLQPWKGAMSLPPALISAPISTAGKPVQITVNAEGLTESNRLHVSVLDEQFRELPGFSARACTAPTRSGLREHVRWGTQDHVSSKGPIRIRVDFNGPQSDELKLYGVYVTPSPSEMVPKR